MIVVSQIIMIINLIIFTTLLSTTGSSIAAITIETSSSNNNNNDKQSNNNNNHPQQQPPPRKLSQSSTADIIIRPTSYSTINGASGSNFNYWDTSYTPPPTRDYQPLSNSLGTLSDGYKELTSTRRDRPSSYVGWYKTPPVLLKFFFNETNGVVIDKIKISVDDYHPEDDRYCRPYKILVGRLDYLFPPPPSSAKRHEPYEAVFNLVSRLVGVTEVDIRIYRRCSWMAVSEIEFTRTVDMTKVMPVRYDTANGGTGILRRDDEVNFWDDSYTIDSSGATGDATSSMAGLAPPRRSYVFLSGGTGRLTDGYKELKSSYHELSRSSYSSSPYVGWRWAECCQPDISFFFAELTVVEEVRIAIDDPIDQKGDACRPVEAIIGGVRYEFPPNERAVKEGERSLGPYEAVIRLKTPILERQVRLLLISNCDWVFLSEVGFYAFDGDGDGVPDELDECPSTIPDDGNGVVNNHYIWNGGTNDKISFVTKIGNRLVPSDHYNIKSTKGCSCTQILDIFEKAGREPTNHRNGCSTFVLNEWMALGFAFANYNNNNNNNNNNPTTRPKPPPPPQPTPRPTPPPTKTPTTRPVLKPITLPPTLPCYPWCDANPTPWFAPRGTSHKCNWTNSCAGCAPCFDDDLETTTTTSPTKSPIPMIGSGPCVNWCRSHDKPWEEKCTWIYSCAGCRECY